MQRINEANPVFSPPKDESHIPSQPLQDDEEETSSSGSSIDSSDDDDDDGNQQSHENKSASREETISSLPKGAHTKPRIHRIERSNPILNKLRTFLPQMKTANEALQRELEAGRGRNVRLEREDDDGGEEAGEEAGEGEGGGGKGKYIEMNLGLGVLEEKRPGDEDGDHDMMSGDEGENEQGEGQTSHAAELPSRPKDSSVLGKLMGKKENDSKKPTIEEMNE